MVTEVVSTDRPKPAGLTPNFVKRVTHPGRYGDGRGGFGLSLLVKPASNGRLSKSWNQRIRISGQLHDLGLGSYPGVSLAQARNKALDHWQRVKAGEDIMATRNPPPTVAEAFDQEIETRSEGWRTTTTARSWRGYKRHCKPILSKRVSDVTPQDVLSTLKPIWHSITRGSPKNPHRFVRGHGNGHHQRTSH